MSEADDVRKIKQAYKEGDMLTRAIITFTACTRKICESNASPAIKGDAMSHAVRYLQSAIGADLCRKMLESDLPDTIVISVTGLELFDQMQQNQSRLQNIMELI